jgi:ADP-ribose pyrophosphatase
MHQYNDLRTTEPDLFSGQHGIPLRILTEHDDIALAEQQVFASLANHGRSPDERLCTAGLIADDRFAYILRDPVRTESGRYGLYLRIVQKPVGVPGVVVLPVYRNNIVLLRQYRHALQNWSFGLVGGFGTTGLTAEQTARKELAEEVGGIVSTITHIGSVASNPGLLSTIDELYLAELDSISPNLQPIAYQAPIDGVSVLAQVQNSAASPDEEGLECIEQVWLVPVGLIRPLLSHIQPLQGQLAAALLLSAEHSLLTDSI